MRLELTYDMRAPAFGAPIENLYATALDQVQWADELGFNAVGLGEHHCSPDGYNPSPLNLAAAMGARSKQITLRTTVLLAPLYDPIKLAEDAAVTHLATGGRLELGIGGGYRPSEFESLGRKLEDRWQAIGETIHVLRQAWTGEPFEWQGRRCWVTPKPPTPPKIILGGASAAAARRAARIADGWYPPLEPKLWEPYREECIKLGKPDPGAYCMPGPIFLWVANDIEKAWQQVMPHVQHQLQSYSEWTIEAYGKPSGPYAKAITPETIRQSPAYQVMTPEQVLAMAEQLPENSVLFLNPLLSGIDPQLSWEMLALFEREVHPYLQRLA